ncbi:gypsy/ty3 retroelement polyprotein [Tanacetum coccineum]
MYEGEVVKRFSAIYEDPIVDLKNLKQEASIQQYQEAFETLLNRVELNEAYAVSLFIGGLKKEELEEKRAKNQCFYYDQKYFVGHKYSGQLYSLEVVSENDNELVTEVEDEAFKDCVEEVITIESSPQISLNALSGLNSFQTMRVKGMFGKHTLHILVDCGSTHSLLDLKTAKNIGYKFDNTTPLQVSVANGQNMMSCYECKNFQWSLQGETFTSDVMLLPLGGCEMVLGIQWLATLGDIQCNFQNRLLQFDYNGRKYGVKGNKEEHKDKLDCKGRVGKQKWSD